RRGRRPPRLVGGRPARRVRGPRRRDRRGGARRARAAGRSEARGKQAMNGALAFALLALATTALACVATSAATAASWSWLQRATRRLRTEDQQLAWMLVALGPVLVSVLLLVAAGIPSIRAELDHCLSHGHHPHLCFRHAGAVAPSPLLIAIALLVPMRLAI